MKTRISLQKLGFVIVLVVILSLLVSATAYARADDGTVVELFRLGGNYAGVKITFPNDVSNGRYLVMVAGKGFDCEVTQPNIVYCIGVYPRSTGPTNLYVIDLETKETVHTRFVFPPVPKGFGIPEVEPGNYPSTPSSSSSGGSGGSTPPSTPPGGTPPGGTSIGNPPLGGPLFTGW
jgi:hypothetical protein